MKNILPTKADKVKAAHKGPMLLYLYGENEQASKASNASSSNSVADEIRKFKALLDDNIITQEEFEAKKKELLQQ